MARFRFFTAEGVCVEAVEPRGASRGNALILLGMPATIGESDLTRFLGELGWTTLQPHYHGTYDSDGRFSPVSAAETVASVVQSISKGAVRETKKNREKIIDPDVSLVVGYSFGAHVAFRCLASLVRVQWIVLLAPAVAYGDPSTGFESEDLSFLDYVQRSRPFTYRLGEREAWAQLFSGEDNEFRAIGSKHRLEEVLAFVGSEDEGIDATMLREGLERLVPSLVGNSVGLRVRVVPGAGHSSTQLLTEETRREISESMAAER